MNAHQMLLPLYFLVILPAHKTLSADFTNSMKVNGVKIKCLDKEREALLKIKDELIDESGELSSWGTTQECCIWSGVSCDNQTNHVIALHVAGVNGKISPWLIELQYLSYLDLSRNDFNGSMIPPFIGSLSRLQHLDLAASKFSNLIPQHLGNLSELQFLDLGYNFMLNSSDLNWLSRLQSLNYLHLSYLNLKEATNWFHAITNLPKLQQLDLVSCQLQSPSSIPMLKNASNSLSVIDLSNNELSSSTPLFLWIFNSSSSLTEIDLSSNNLQGRIPDAIGNIVSLETLELGRNDLEGTIPKSFWNLSNLVRLSISYNRLGGTLEQSMGNLSKLQYLILGQNQFEGVITEAHFFNLSRLQLVSIYTNPQLSFSFNSGWIPPFQLNSLFIEGCKVGPYFPTWLRTQKELEELVITNAGIRDTFPNWLLDICSKLRFFNLSNNDIHGVLPDLSLAFPTFYSFDLSYNDFNSSLPLLSSNGTLLILSNNKFSGPLTVLCNKTDWVHLDLSNNLLSGDFPYCLATLKNLEYLSLANNNFSGKISSLNLNNISSLRLQNNSFTGEILTSFKNCTLLKIIDLSKNKLTGEIPVWLGDKLSKLVFLSLRSNHFSGSIPSTLCHLAHMQVLDISSNNIYGLIPKCLNNLTAMIQAVDSSNSFRFQIAFAVGYVPAAVIWKGEEYEYYRTLNLVVLVDLSNNNLQGEIPLEITSLKSLVGLNLSRNNLTGFLPPKIEQLNYLNFLDLSRNRFYGEIPTGLSHLDHLGVLDLSYNNLSGRIPWMGHLQTFNSSSYVENVGLCGPPLTKMCPGDEIDQQPKLNNNSSWMINQEDKLITPGFYISIAIGFIFGFWGVVGTLVLNQQLGHAYFNFWSNIVNWLYIKMAKIRRRYLTNM